MYIMEERDELEFLDVIIIIVGFAVIILRFNSGSLDLWAARARADALIKMRKKDILWMWLYA